MTLTKIYLTLLYNDTYYTIEITLKGTKLYE